MHIRAATSADAPVIGRIYTQCFAAAFSRILDPEILEGLTPERAERQIRRSLQAGASVRVAVHKREGVVGVISVVTSDGSLPEYPREVELHCVSEEFQRRGIGRSLLRGAAGDSGALVVWLPTRLPACSFYEHLGGRRLGTRATTIEGKPLESTAFGLKQTTS
jgi:ribosomal protein S18 acetylase RimI-like enzyme